MRPVVDAYATEAHYLDHLLPVWRALPRDVRGRLHLVGPADRRARDLEVRPDDRRRPRPARRLTLVAGYQDVRSARGRPIALVNHGAGQTYDGDPRSARHPAYSGGDGRERVELFLEPGPYAAEKSRLRYDAPVREVGCPKLDPWHAGRRPVCRSPGSRPYPPSEGRNGREGRRDRPIVAVSFHWPCGLVPETSWAWGEYRDAVARLARDGSWTVLGHGHPRAWRRLERWYRAAGIEAVPDFGDVLDRADLYVVDNSSTAYEFASTDRPVVLMNSERYRRDVDHGLRFWSHSDVGIQVDRPADLRDAVREALTDPPDVREMRDRIVRDVYAHVEGDAAERAAAAVLAVARDPD